MTDDLKNTYRAEEKLLNLTLNNPAAQGEFAEAEKEKAAALLPACMDLIKTETEKVGEAEMLRRDTFVMVAQLQTQKKLQQRDHEHLTGTQTILEMLRVVLMVLPLSEAKIREINKVTKQLDQIDKQLIRSVFPRSNQITLTALELSLGSYPGPQESKPESEE